MPNFPDIEAGKNFIGKFSLGEVRKSDDFSYFCGMQKYIEYISDLLYLHDCVIIPDFGGFICNYTGAYIDETNGTICPPAKEILFNRNLTHNDGLLAGWIAARESIPYEKATQALALFADDLKSRLNRRERVPFGEIGVFYVDRRFNILFENGDRNFLAESFGMEPIAVRETGQNHPVEINLPQPAALHVPAPQPGKHIVRRLQRTVKYGVAVAAVAGIVVLSQWDIFHNGTPVFGKKIQNSTAITPELSLFPHRQSTVLYHNVISPESDYVDYDPIADFDL